MSSSELPHAELYRVTHLHRGLTNPPKLVEEVPPSLACALYNSCSFPLRDLCVTKVGAGHRRWDHALQPALPNHLQHVASPTRPLATGGKRWEWKREGPAWNQTPGRAVGSGD